MENTEILSMKQFLISQRTAILNKTAEFKNTQMNLVLVDKMADETDQSIQEQQVSLSLHLQERDRELLFQIDKALGKITTGVYGECESCGDEISAKRLQARPFANLCILCQEEQELSKSTEKE